MAIEIYTIVLLFFTGLLFATMMIVFSLKRPLKLKSRMSICEECNEPFTWYQLIPLVSYFTNKKKCPYCHKELNIWYYVLELMGAILFSLAYVIYDFSYEMLIMIIISLLTISIYVSDFKYYVILDEPLLIFSILILILKWIFFGWRTLLISILSGIIIFIFMLGVKKLGLILFKRESIGGGDIKLAALFGFCLGIRLSIISLVIGSFLAFPLAIYYSLVGKEKEIPFGPFLVSGLFVVFVFMVHINRFISVVFK
jgi:prepilin signal peptidase PulO-like enzyme (type II secretory pathway)